MEEDFEVPEEGELVIAMVREITSHGVYVTLDEYKGINGFLHISEISTGWVRNIERYARLGQKLVLKVIRVVKQRKEIDLSLRLVTGEEKKEKLIAVKKSEKAKSIVEIVATKLNLSAEDNEKYVGILLEKFDTLYDALEEVVEKDLKVLQKLDLPSNYIETLEATAKEKIIIPLAKVQGVLELTSTLPNGIEIIKQAIIEAEKVKAGRITTSYLSSPRYRIVVKARDYKLGKKIMNNAIEKIRQVMDASKGTFKFIDEK